jgi:hypothetical protein
MIIPLPLYGNLHYLFGSAHIEDIIIFTETSKIDYKASSYAHFLAMQCWVKHTNVVGYLYRKKAKPGKTLKDLWVGKMINTSETLQGTQTHCIQSLRTSYIQR